MGGDRGLDRLMDRAVVPGYTNLGFAIRSRGWPDDDPAPDALLGRRALVTGAGRGLGEATALGLARLGASVHLVVRSLERSTAALERISQALLAEGRRPQLHVEECDVSDLAAVRRFADQFVRRPGRHGGELDIVVHNAGVLPATWTASVDGHELTLATHVLGPVLMTELLMPALRRSASGARTIFVSSGGQYTQALHPSDLEYRRDGYRGPVAYARSKRIQVELTPKMAARWSNDGLAVYSMHPGWADTPGVATSLPGFRAVTRPLLRTTAEGADTTVWLAATKPAPASGTFWHDRRQRPTNYVGRAKSSPSEVEQVWDWVKATLQLEPGP